MDTTMNKKPIISIIIVYFGEKKEIKKLLASIKNSKTKTSYEIILVNNKVGDDTCSKLASKGLALQGYIKTIESGGDLGYGKGNNLGAKSAKGKYIFIINPDTVIKTGSLDVLTKFLDNHKKAAIVAPNLIYDNGEYLESIGTRTLTPIRAIFALSILNQIFPNNPISNHYYLKDMPKNELREADTIPGTAFMIRTNIFKKFKGFDPNFFLYFEEFELCKRIRDKGYKIFVTPDAVVEHDWEPAEQTPDSKYFKESRFYYMKKHYGILWALVVEFFTRLSKRSLMTLLIAVIAAILLII
jgi:GT2 family glycosyltransferase